MQVSDFIRPEHVIVDLVAATKSEVLRNLSDHAGRVLGIEGKGILQALRKREQLGSTGIGEGVAIPHARIPGITQAFGLFARLNRPVDFQLIDELPVDIVFLLLIPAEGKQELNTLACIARQLRSEGALRKIRQATDAMELYSAIAMDA